MLPLPKQYRRYVAVAVQVLTTVGAIIAVIAGALPKGSQVASSVAIGAALLGQGIVVLKFVEGESQAQVAKIYGANYDATTTPLPESTGPNAAAIAAELGA